MERKRSVTFYLLMAIGISATAFWGFSYTYFSPMAKGTYPTVPISIHIHGWSFFFWYLLFPLQAMLIARHQRSLHIKLGLASLALAAIMVVTGLLVASVRIGEALANGADSDLDAFWQSFGLVITAGLVLFAGFYAAAIASRRRPQAHKRLMVMASASALPAAVFRIIVGLGGYNWLATPSWVIPTAFFLPNVFIIAGMVHDHVTRRAIHTAYLIGLPIAVAIQTLGFMLATHPSGDALRRAIALFRDLF